MCIFGSLDRIFRVTFLVDLSRTLLNVVTIGGYCVDLDGLQDEISVFIAYEQHRFVIFARLLYKIFWIAFSTS